MSLTGNKIKPTILGKIFEDFFPFSFTTSETELDCYNQRVNVRVALRVPR